MLVTTCFPFYAPHLRLGHVCRFHFVHGCVCASLYIRPESCTETTYIQPRLMKLRMLTESGIAVIKFIINSVTSIVIVVYLRQVYVIKRSCGAWGTLFPMSVVTFLVQCSIHLNETAKMWSLIRIHVFSFKLRSE